MHTRRDSFLLMTALPLFATEAIAQDRADVSSIFDDAIADLQSPPRVWQNYGVLAFYLELLAAEKRKPADIEAAQKTFQLVGDSIRSSGAKFDKSSENQIRSSLEQEYKKYREELFSVLKSAGIATESLAGRIIEKSLASMLIFYAVATNVKEISQLVWCIFPFCFKRPA